MTQPPPTKEVLSSWRIEDVQDYFIFMTFICKVPIHRKYVCTLLAQTNVAQNGQSVLMSLQNPTEGVESQRIGEIMNQSTYQKQKRIEQNGSQDPLEEDNTLRDIAQYLLGNVVLHCNDMLEKKIIPKFKLHEIQNKIKFDTSRMIAVTCCSDEKNLSSPKEDSVTLRFRALSPEELTARNARIEAVGLQPADQDDTYCSKLFFTALEQATAWRQLLSKQDSNNNKCTPPLFIPLQAYKERSDAMKGQITTVIEDSGADDGDRSVCVSTQATATPVKENKNKNHTNKRSLESFFSQHTKRKREEKQQQQPSENEPEVICISDDEG